MSRGGGRAMNLNEGVRASVCQMGDPKALGENGGPAPPSGREAANHNALTLKTHASMKTHGRLLAILTTAVALLAHANSAHADWPSTQTTVKARRAVRTDRTHYLVTAVVFPHGARIDKVEFGAPGRWGKVGHLVRQRRDGGLVYQATLFGHPGGSWQARSRVDGRPDDYSDVARLP